MMRKCEIAGGVVNLLIFAYYMLQLFTFNAPNLPADLGIVGGADGPSVIYIPLSISDIVIGIAPPMLCGMLLLMPPRRNVIVISSVLFGFYYTIYVLYFLISIILEIPLISAKIYPDMTISRNMSFMSFFPLLLGMANMSLLIPRGVGQWREGDPEPPLETDTAMRKCEIAVGVIDLLLAVLLALPPHVVGIVGSLGTTAILSLYVRISNTAFFVMASAGILLLMPPRRKVIGTLSILWGALLVIPVLYSSIATITYPHSWDWDTGALATIACFLLFSIANISLLLRRGVGGWRNRRSGASV